MTGYLPEPRMGLLSEGYAASCWGGLWMILNPMSEMLNFAFVFSEVLSARLPGIDNQVRLRHLSDGEFVYWPLSAKLSIVVCPCSSITATFLRNWCFRKLSCHSLLQVEVALLFYGAAFVLYSILLRTIRVSKAYAFITFGAQIGLVVSVSIFFGKRFNLLTWNTNS
jgi:multidrug transporter EmrE-like cation transporter